MKKFCLVLVAILAVHISFACSLNSPPIKAKTNTNNTTVTDSLENKNLQKDKAVNREPEKKKHYRRVVLIFV